MLLRRELLASALPLRGVRFHDWWIAFVAASSGSIDDVDEPPVICRQHEHSQRGWCCRAWCGWLREHALRVTAFNRRISFGRFALKQFFGMRWRMAIAGTHG